MEISTSIERATNTFTYCANMNRLIVAIVCLCALSTLAAGFRGRRGSKPYSMAARLGLISKKTTKPQETRFCVERPSQNANEPFVVYVTLGGRYIKNANISDGKQDFFSSLEVLNAKDDVKYHGMTGVEVETDCSNCPDPEDCPGVCEVLFLCRSSEEDLNNAKEEEGKYLKEHGYMRNVVLGHGKYALKVTFKFDKGDVFGDVKVSMNPGRGQWRYFNEPLVGWGNGPCKYNAKGIDNEKAVCVSSKKWNAKKQPDFVGNTCFADLFCVLQESEDSKWGKEGSRCRNNNGVCTSGGKCPKGSRIIRAWDKYTTTVRDHCLVDGKDGLCKEKSKGCEGGKFHDNKCPTKGPTFKCCVPEKEEKPTDECDDGLVCCREETLRGTVVGASSDWRQNIGTCVKSEETCKAIPGVVDGHVAIKNKEGDTAKDLWYCNVDGKKQNGVACGIERDRLLEWRKENNANFFGYTTEYKKRGTPGGNCLRDEDTLWEHIGGLKKNRDENEKVYKIKGPDGKDDDRVKPVEWDTSHGLCFAKKCPKGFEAFTMPDKNKFLDHHKAEINDPKGEKARKTSTIFCNNDVKKETVCCRPSKWKEEKVSRRRLLGRTRGDS